MHHGLFVRESLNTQNEDGEQGESRQTPLLCTMQIHSKRRAECVRERG